MKLTAFNIKPKKTRSGNPRIVMVHLSRNEALRTIASLTSQLISNNPNVERYELETDSGEYFSIGVSEIL